MFSRCLSLDDDLTLFTYRDVAIATWNMSVALSEAGLLPCGIGWALAPEDGADPTNCSSGDWADREHRAIAAAWQALLDERTDDRYIGMLRYSEPEQRRTSGACRVGRPRLPAQDHGAG